MNRKGISWTPLPVYQEGGGNSGTKLLTVIANDFLEQCWCKIRPPPSLKDPSKAEGYMGWYESCRKLTISWLPCYGDIRLNAFCVESVLDEEGTIFINVYQIHYDILKFIGRSVNQMA